MKNQLLFLTLTSLALFCGVSHAKAEPLTLDNIVAVVNDDVVTQSELNQSLSITKAQLSARGGVPSQTVLQKQVLNQLISKKLQLQIAKQTGISVTDSDIDQVVQKVATDNNISVNALYQRINQEGMATSTYRNELRDQLTVQRLQQQEVGSRLKITPEEITGFMHSALWQGNADKEYHLEDILIPLSDSPGSDEIVAAKKRANVLMSKLKQGLSFHEAAQKESGGKSALQGGDLGWRKLPEIPSSFASHVVSMQIKDVAGPIQTANGFHLIRLAEERTIKSKDSAPDRKQIERLLLQRKFEEHVQNWVSKMRSQAFIVMNP